MTKKLKHLPEDHPHVQRIRKAARRGDLKIESAPTEHIECLRPQVQRVLNALGFSTAFVTDKSCVGDFPHDDEKLAKASETLGIELKGSDYIWEVAKRLLN